MNQKIQIFLILVLLTIVNPLNAQENEIICLYNNFGQEAGDAILDWGFAAFVRYNDKLILFDGGSSTDILAHNAKIFDIDLTKVEFAVLSHNHWDHLTGFDYLLKINPEVQLYLPDDHTLGAGSTSEDAEWNKKYQRGFRFRDRDMTFVKQNMQIAPGIALIPTTSSLTGWFSKYPPHDKEPRTLGLPELSLALQTKEEQWTLVVGCSHSQVENIVQETRDYVKSNVSGVAGGFHLIPYSSENISDLANMMKEELQVNWIAPGHCSGDSARQIFKELYQDNYRYFGLGSRIKF
jgi:7,8-dihydropterin-6-yl-methyl-4-(beta-D-ribofuranosyl)aminobenzene 5'-phosphate synthase